MRRFLPQFLSIPSALVVGVFNYVGSNTFHDGEKTFATIVLYYCATLLAVAIANFFSERLFWLHLVLAAGLAVSVAGTIVYVNFEPLRPHSVQTEPSLITRHTLRAAIECGRQQAQEGRLPHQMRSVRLLFLRRGPGLGLRQSTL
jgi:hypothetical protein